VFTFKGKSNKEREVHIDDEELIPFIMEAAELPGYEIFRYKSSKPITTMQYKLIDDTNNIHQVTWQKTTKKYALSFEKGKTMSVSHRTTETVTSRINGEGKTISSTYEKSIDLSVHKSKSGTFIGRETTNLYKDFDNSYDLNENPQALKFANKVKDQVEADEEWNPWNDNVGSEILPWTALLDGIYTFLGGKKSKGFAKRQLGITAALGIKNLYRRNADHSGRSIDYLVPKEGDLFKIFPGDKKRLL